MSSKGPLAAMEGIMGRGKEAQRPIRTLLQPSVLRGCSRLGDRVRVNTESGKGRRHYLSQSILESCVDEIFHPLKDLFTEREK